MLLPIEQLIAPALLSEFRQGLEKAVWEEGFLTAGGQAAHIKSNLQVKSSDEQGQRLGQQILGILNSHPDFISAALPSKVFPPKFNLYQNGGHYGLHVDNAIMQLSSGHSMRTDLSATIFLNEPDAYEGGELVIETQYGAQEVKLNAGDMILYPSTSLHEVRPVSAGQRICAFFWVESMVRDNQQREMLYDLDQSIQNLTRERGSDDMEVRRLSGIYHNLVRQWSST